MVPFEGVCLLVPCESRWNGSIYQQLRTLVYGHPRSEEDVEVLGVDSLLEEFNLAPGILQRLLG